MPASDPYALPGALVSLLGPERVLEDEATATYAVDGLRPAVVARPTTVEELAAALAEASRLGTAVIPWGGGTAMALGNPPRAYDLALDTRGLDRVIEYEPADLTITVEAGITLARLQEVLAQHGQFFPIDPPGWQEATLGGVLSSGAIGPSRHAYGPARDWVLGLRVAHPSPEGRISRGGGRVVKNVAGYDMPKLYLGSLGTLGVIVETSLKVTPLPASEATWLASLGTGKRHSLAGAVSLALEAHARSLRLRALAVVRGDEALTDPIGGGTWVAAWAAGTAAAVERSLREMDGLILPGKDAGLETRRLDAAEGADWWERVRALCRPSSAEEASVRATLLPSRMAAFLAEMEALKPLTVVAYPAAGIAYGRFEGKALWAKAVARLRRAARPEEGGSVIVEAGPRALKERIDVFGDPQEDFPLMRRLKEQMDPLGVLNPGRFLGRL